MSATLAVLAQPAVAAVAGLEGSFPWGDAVASAAGTAGADAVVALGAATADGPEPDVRWLGGPLGPAPTPPGRRVIATSGEGLWSRAAWPVRDELFKLDPPDAGGDLLVVTGDQDLHGPLLEKLSGRGIRIAVADGLTADGLASAAAVAFPPATQGDLGTSEREEAIPAAAFAALAAGRPLIAPRVRVTFGLLPGVDHLAASADDEIVQYADALQAFPDVFVPLIALGRIAAERQRASTVYGRLVAELATAAPRSAGPRG